MAAENAPHSEPQPLERAVLLDGLNGILRAGRRETAGRRRERGDISLVKRMGAMSSAARNEAAFAWRYTSSVGAISSVRKASAPSAVFSASEPAGIAPSVKAAEGVS